jgi:hypothetical protein
MLQNIVALAPFVPLLQTLLWVALVGALVAWFNKPIRQILLALRQRIETGSAVKAGWFELSELKPQPAEQQRQRAQLELAEATPEQAAASSSKESTRPAPTSAQFLLAEDLARRALQADLGVALNRQIAAGPDAGFDAAFARGGSLNVVEVKFFPGSITPTKLRTSLDRIASAVARVHWNNVRIVLVLVFKRAEDVYLYKEATDRALNGFLLPVEIRTYSLPELQSRFGVVPGDA